MDSVCRAYSIRRKSQVLGIRRQTYYARKQGYRPEQEDNRIAERLHAVIQQFIAWGFWRPPLRMSFHYLRDKGYVWNHKRVYRVWKEEDRTAL